jgi:hypothetical protein
MTPAKFNSTSLLIGFHPIKVVMVHKASGVCSVKELIHILMKWNSNSLLKHFLSDIYRSNSLFPRFD